MNDEELRVADEKISLKSLVKKRVEEVEDSSARISILCFLRELEESLAGILEELKVDGRRWVVIIETAGVSVRYVQVLVTKDGGLWVECVSDEFLGPEDKLSDEQRELLPLLGWHWPSPPAGPNWQLHDELLDTGTAISGLLLRTLREVFGCASTDLARFQLFQSTHGGQDSDLVPLYDSLADTRSRNLSVDDWTDEVRESQARKFTWEPGDVRIIHPGDPDSEEDDYTNGE